MQWQKIPKTSNCHKSAIMDFQTIKFWDFTQFIILIKNISKNEKNLSFKLLDLPQTAPFLEKLALKVSSRKIVSIEKCTLGILLSSSKYVPSQIFLNLEILVSAFCRLEQFCLFIGKFLAEKAHLKEKLTFKQF